MQQLERRTLLTAQLFYDLYATTDHNSDFEMARIDDVVYTAANDGVHGAELFRTDGTAEGTYLLKDINPGPGDAFRYPDRQFADVDGTLFFFADDGTHGLELWRSDGSAGGTVMVKDINPRGDAQAIERHAMAVAGGLLYFTAVDETGRQRIWRSDGTAEGTTLVHDTGGDTRARVAANWMVPLGDGVVYQSRNTLYYSDATVTGTPLTSSNVPYDARPAKSRDYVYFKAVGNLSEILWRTDGTAQGTIPVQDVPTEIYDDTPKPRGLVDVNGVLFFLSRKDGTYDLWKSDGTPGGTAKVLDLNVTPKTSEGFPAAAVNGIYYFGDSESRLWRSDGTAEGTYPIRDFQVPGAYSEILTLTPFGDKLLFTAPDKVGDSVPNALWITDGTLAGTLRLHDSQFTRYPAYNAVNKARTLVFPFGDKAFFTGGTLTPHGPELWVTNGTPAGTREVKDINDRGQSSDPRDFHRIGDITFFQSGPYGASSIWRTDGTHAGTERLMVHPEFQPLRQVVKFEQHYYFVADRQLIRSDGTRAGTQKLIPSTLDQDTYSMADGALVPLGKYLYFVGAGPGVSGQIYRTRGMPESFEIVSDLPRGMHPLEVVELGGRLILTTTYDGLWRIDGPASEEVQLKAAPSQPVLQSTSGLLRQGDQVLFRAADAQGYELWRTDGTPAGTVRVRDLKPGAADGIPEIRGAPTFVAGPGGHAYFVADDGVRGQELWRTDGTASGTTLVADVLAGAAGSQPRNLTAAMGYLYFSAAGGTYRTDGTAGGTVRLDDPSRGPVVGSDFTAFAGRVYFTGVGTDGSPRLWSTDGSPGGTEPVRDVPADAPLNYSRHYDHFPWPRIATAGDSLVFAADQFRTGSELWQYPAKAPATRIRLAGTEGPNAITLTREGDTVWAAMDRSAAPYRADAVTEIVLDGLTAEDSVTFDGGFDEVINLPPEIGTLRLNADSRVKLSGPQSVRQLDLATGAQLDIGDGSLTLPHSPRAYSVLRDLLASARTASAGRWAGAGVTSSLAQAHAFGGLALLLGNPDEASMTVKYTYDGDANADGRVNADDYFRIDSGFLDHPQDPLYTQGDFNYDGKINADDYFLIDSAFLGQGQPLTGEALIAVVPSAATPVPAESEGIVARKRPVRPLFSDRFVGVLDASRRAGVARRR